MSEVKVEELPGMLIGSSHSFGVMVHRWRTPPNLIDPSIEKPDDFVVQWLQVKGLKNFVYLLTSNMIACGSF